LEKKYFSWTLIRVIQDNKSIENRFLNQKTIEIKKHTKKANASMRIAVSIPEYEV